MSIVGEISGRGLRSTEFYISAVPREVKHAHALGRLFLIYEGTIVDRLEGREEVCEAGHLLFRPFNLCHEFHFEKMPVRFIAIEIEPELQGEFDLLFERPLDPARVGLKMFGEAVHLIREEIRIADYASPLAIHAAVCTIVAIAARAMRQGHRRPSWIDRAVTLIDQQFTKPIGVGSIAIEVGLSPQHLSSRFKAETGCTVGEYIRRRRLEQARRLLAQTSTCLTDIAAQVGFYDQSHFARAFRSHIGETPAQFRRRLRPADDFSRPPRRRSR